MLIRLEIPGFFSSSKTISEPESVTVFLNFSKIVSGGSKTEIKEFLFSSDLDIFLSGFERLIIFAPVVEI